MPLTLVGSKFRKNKRRRTKVRVIGSQTVEVLRMASNSGLLDAFVTVRQINAAQTNAAHASALDAPERAFTAETVLFGWLRHQEWVQSSNDHIYLPR